jgi:hypothetical protein
MQIRERADLLPQTAPLLREGTMTPGEIAVLTVIVAAFVAFSAVLGWAARD